MIRRLAARSIVVAGAFAILGMLQYHYGIGSVIEPVMESIGLATLATTFSEGAERIKVEGNLRSGFRAGAYNHIKSNLPGIQALYFSYDNKNLALYIGRRQLSSGNVVIIVDQDLFLFMQKGDSADYRAFPYTAEAARVPIVTADRVALRGSQTPVEAVWTEQKEQGNWKLKLKGAPGETGKVIIVVPDALPVYSKTSLPFAIPMVLSAAQFTASLPHDLRTCLENVFSDTGFYVAPADPRLSTRPLDSQRLTRDNLLELDLGGDAIDLTASPDMNPNSDASRICRDSSRRWLDLPENEKIERYRSELSETGELHTILIAYR